MHVVLENKISAHYLLQWTLNWDSDIDIIIIYYVDIDTIMLTIFM